MRAEFAKVLYVVAYDNVEGKKSDVRGPQAGHGYTKRQIAEELTRHFPPNGSDRDVIDKACALLLRQNYFELKGGKSGKLYLLHEKFTEPTLILDRNDAKIVLTISELADMEDQFPLDYAIKKGAEETGLSEDDVQRRIEARSQTINTIKGYFFPGQAGTYEINTKTVEEERPYLELVANLGFKTPRPVAQRPTQVKGRPATRRSKTQAKKPKARPTGKAKRRS